jgi:predicted dehydrogenase
VAPNVAIIGTGFMGAVHARAARAAGARLVGVLGSTPERSAEAKHLTGADRAYLCLDDLTEAGDVDVVHVCTPTYLHAPITMAALTAGKHVVCEKPPGVDADEAAQLAAVARTNGAVAAIPFVYRYYPMIQQARAARYRDGCGWPSHPRSGLAPMIPTRILLAGTLLTALIPVRVIGAVTHNLRVGLRVPTGRQMT